MKRFVSILFCLLLCISQVGFYVGFLIEQHKTKNLIKKQAISKIPLNLLVRIEQNQSIEWEEEQKEFYLNGFLYDVVKCKMENGKTVFYCINDENEAQLLKTLSVIAESGNHHSNSRNHHYQINKLIFDEFEGYNNLMSIIKIERVIQSYSKLDLYFPQINLTVDFPPPRV